jgi:hypothetical protein
VSILGLLIPEFYVLQFAIGWPECDRPFTLSGSLSDSVQHFRKSNSTAVPDLLRQYRHIKESTEIESNDLSHVQTMAVEGANWQKLPDIPVQCLNRAVLNWSEINWTRLGKISLKGFGMMTILIARSTNWPIVEVHEFWRSVIVFIRILRQRYKSVRTVVLRSANQNKYHVKTSDKQS